MSHGRKGGQAQNGTELEWIDWTEKPDRLQASRTLTRTKAKVCSR